MVDNFDQILQEILHFESPEEFYFPQIIRRAKDNLHIGANNQFIKARSIYSKEDLEQKRAGIIDLCTLLNARAYIHPSPRNDHDIALMMLEELAKLTRTKQYSNARNLWATMCGRYIPPGPKRRWIVDIDGDLEDEPDDLISDIDTLQPVGSKVLLHVPTKAGYHLITRPFNLQAFSILYPNIDVHKNNPTLLYCP